MPRRPQRPPYQRARTDSQKSERRRAILAGADAHLRESGFEAFSMGVLAKQVGIAKGTLYLYFETREEVLLSLYAEQLADWSDALAAAFRSGMSDRELARVFYDVARADPVFLDLSARLGSVIEHNVSLPRLIESKRSMRTAFAALGERLAPLLGMDAASAVKVVVALGALLIGAAQLDAGPSLENEVLPEEVRDVMAMFASDDVFMTHAPVLLSDIRARSLPEAVQRKA